LPSASWDRVSGYVVSLAENPPLAPRAAKGGAPQLKKQFYVLAQYTRFIRPGFQIISAGGAYNTLAAYSPSSKRLVLVSTNWDVVMPNDLDLSAFTNITSSATVYRTTADESVNLQEGRISVSSKGHLVDQLPVRSVTTYVIDDVAPLPVPASPSIEGTHKIVSEGTKLCLNINRNSTQSGEAIIPYPCSGFSNMVFNFVDQRNGFYSIHSEWHPESLPERLKCRCVARRRQEIRCPWESDSVELQQRHVA
jgi:hypothetical protein